MEILGAHIILLFAMAVGLLDLWQSPPFDDLAHRGRKE